jgi:Uma2 family endonuclease
MSQMRTKVNEYLAFGVAFVWIIDPDTRRADLFQALDE